MYNGLDMEEAIEEYARRSKIVYTGLLKMCSLPPNTENDLIGIKFREAKTLIDCFRMTFREKYLGFVGSPETWCDQLDPLPTYNWSLLNRFENVWFPYLPVHTYYTRGGVRSVSHDHTEGVYMSYRLAKNIRATFACTGSRKRNGSFGHVMKMNVTMVGGPSAISSVASLSDLPTFHLWLSKVEHHYATEEIKVSNPNWANDVWRDILPELMGYIVGEAPVTTMKEATDKMDEALVLMENARAMMAEAKTMMEYSRLVMEVSDTKLKVADMKLRKVEKTELRTRSLLPPPPARTAPPPEPTAPSSDPFSTLDPFRS